MSNSQRQAVITLIEKKGKDRTLIENWRPISLVNLDDIMDLRDKENMPGLLRLIDFEKAFDSSEWKFLFNCLNVFNFGPNFKRWIKTFYKNIKSCVVNNGLCSDFFVLTRGVRQGDPLSLYLFLLAVETLLIAIRANVEEIRRIRSKQSRRNQTSPIR